MNRKNMIMIETSTKNNADGRIRISPAVQIELDIQYKSFLECIARIKRAKNNTKKLTKRLSVIKLVSERRWMEPEINAPMPIAVNKGRNLNLPAYTLCMTKTKNKAVNRLKIFWIAISAMFVLKKRNTNFKKSG